MIKFWCYFITREVELLFHVCYLNFCLFFLLTCNNLVREGFQPLLFFIMFCISPFYNFVIFKVKNSFEFYIITCYVFMCSFFRCHCLNQIIPYSEVRITRWVTQLNIKKQTYVFFPSSFTLRFLN